LKFIQYHGYNAPRMVENDLESLESKIDKLIELLQRARFENSSLRKKNSLLSKENIELLDKKKKTAESINSLIVCLNDELLCQTQKQV
jgi:uncharacterized protein (TIGR02449 family)